MDFWLLFQCVFCFAVNRAKKHLDNRGLFALLLLTFHHSLLKAFHLYFFFISYVLYNNASKRI